MKSENSMLQKFLTKIFPEKRGGWGRFDIWKEIDGVNTLYLRRFRIIQTKWFGLYVHYIPMPDQDRHLHDHPWNFGVFLLNGGYVEEIPDPHDPAWETGTGSTITKIRRRFTFRTQQAEQLHRIREILPGTWTLFFRGNKRRHWGFQTENGWKHWLNYLRDEGIFEQLDDNFTPQDPDSSLPAEAL